MEQSVMKQHDPPEVIFGAGRFKITLKGKEAIRAGGWTVRLLLVVMAARIWVVVPIGGITFLVVRWLLS